jgi:glycosyltransferase involved in cell wall biosynthesis
MTMMVRDEIDVVVPMLEHHFDQGVDLAIVTDNGSVDGTTEVLERYAATGKVELHHDPAHAKQQGRVVTTMARRAFTEHGADWVINADADEFLVPLDRSLTIRAALERTPVSLNAFTVPVVNLVGRPAERGAGIGRLTWRDHRSEEQLVAVGVHAHPTPNAIHVGDAGVQVSQGNHFVSLVSRGQPDPAVAMEVLHLPWRSWCQFSQKVVNSGLAYEASPDLRPSPRHHGMADYRRARAGWLLNAFLLRLPPDTDLANGDAFAEDRWLADRLHNLVNRAVFPDLLSPALDGANDQPFGTVEHSLRAEAGALLLALERERAVDREREKELLDTVERLRRRVRRLRRERDAAREKAAREAEWVPIGTDLKRVGRRVAGAVRRRAVRPRTSG